MGIQPEAGPHRGVMRCGSPEKLSCLVPATKMTTKVNGDVAVRCQLRFLERGFVATRTLGFFRCFSVAA